MVLFNPGSIRDFLPKFLLKNNQIDLVDENKLLGVLLRSDFCWSSNTEYIVSRANKKIWFLRMLRTLGANEEDLKDVYTMQIRSVLQFAVPGCQPIQNVTKVRVWQSVKFDQILNVTKRRIKPN